MKYLFLVFLGLNAFAFENKEPGHEFITKGGLEAVLYTCERHVGECRPSRNGINCNELSKSGIRVSVYTAQDKSICGYDLTPVVCACAYEEI